MQPGTNVSRLPTYGLATYGLAAYRIARALLLATAGGMILGRLTVMTVRHDRVFVPQDLEFMGLRPAEPQAISARLAPLIAHGRAGFGGAICTTRDHGLLLCLVRQAQAEQVLCFSGLVGFAAAIGVHPVVGYTNLFHLAPAILGPMIFVGPWFLLPGNAPMVGWKNYLVPEARQKVATFSGWHTPTISSRL